MIEGLLLVGLLIAVALVLGVIAFFQSMAANDEIARLRSEIGLLHRRISGLDPRPGAAPAPAPIAAPVEPAPAAPEPAPEPTIIEPAAAIPDRSAAARASAPTSLVEHGLSGDWLIWIGGAALVLGGAFLVRSAIDAGYFGPAARIVAAFLAGAAMIYAGDRLRRGDGGLAPPVLAGAGGATLYAAIYAAHGLYGLIPSAFTVILLAAASAGMVALAVLHRAPGVAAVGLVGAFAAPMLAASAEPQPAALFLFVLGVAAAGLFVARIMLWRKVVYVAIGGGVFWPLIWLLAGDSLGGAIALAAYLPAFLALNAALAGDDARSALAPPAPPFGAQAFAQAPLATFYLALAAVAALGGLLVQKQGLSAPAVAAFLGLSLVSVAAARWRSGLVLAAPAIALALALAIALAGRPAVDPPVVALFAALFTAGGFILMRRSAPMAIPAALVALSPISFLAALFLAGGATHPAPYWGAAAMAFAIVNLALLRALDRTGGVSAAPGAASAYALGVSLSAMIAVAMATEGLSMSAGLAWQAPVLAYLWRRFRLRALEYAAAFVAIIASARLFLAPDALVAALGLTPFFNLLTPAYLFSAGGFWLAARLLAGGGLSLRRASVQALETAAIALFSAFVSLQIRHAMHGGAIDQRAVSLLEAGLNVTSWVLIAAFMRQRFGAALSLARRWMQRALLGLAGLVGAFGNLLALNPWWGDGGAISGPPIFNVLLIGYLAPAVAFSLAAIAAYRRSARIEARCAGAAAAALGYAWAILSIRQYFHAPNLAVGGVSDAESWGYSLATVVYAAAILIAGALRQSALLRHAGFAALLAATGKVFLVDMAGLDGVLRATAFLGLGAALVGIAALFQRITARRARTPADDQAIQ